MYVQGPFPPLPGDMSWSTEIFSITKEENKNTFSFW